MKSKCFKLSLVVVGFVAFLNVLFIYWLIPRGVFHPDLAITFDAISQKVYSSYVTAAFVLLPKIFFWVTPDVYSYRVLGFFVYLLLGCMLAYRTVIFVDSLWSPNVFPIYVKISFSLLIVLSALDYPLLLQLWVLSHHDLLNWCYMGLFCGLFSLYSNSNWASFLIVGVMGALLCVILLTRFSALFLLIAFVATFLMFYKHYKILSKVHYCIVFVGFVGAFMLFVTHVASFSDFLDSYVYAFVGMSNKLISRGSYLTRYSSEIYSIVLFFFRYLSLPVVLVVLLNGKQRLSLKLPRQVSSTATVVALCSPTILYCLLFISYYLFPLHGQVWWNFLPTTSGPELDNGYYLIFNVLFLFLYSQINSDAKALSMSKGRASGFPDNTISFVLSLLFFLPMSATMFSTQPLSLYLREYTWAYMICLYIMLYTLRYKFSLQAVVVIFFISPMLLFGFQQSRTILATYGTFMHIFDYDTESRSLQPLRGVLVTKEEGDFYLTVKQLMVECGGFSPGDPVLPVNSYYTPNTAHIIGARAPRNKSINEFRSTVSHSSSLPYDISDMKRSFLWVSGDVDGMVSLKLRESGLPFPEGYMLFAKIHDPLTNSMLSMFKPRAIF